MRLQCLFGLNETSVTCDLNMDGATVKELPVPGCPAVTSHV